MRYAGGGARVEDGRNNIGAPVPDCECGLGGNTVMPVVTGGGIPPPPPGVSDHSRSRCERRR